MKQLKKVPPATLPTHRFAANSLNVYWSSSLFNEVYLQHDVPKHKDFWDLTERGPFHQFTSQFIDLCLALKDQKFETWNEAETVKDWIIPIMELLGWQDKCGPNTNPVADNVSYTILEAGKKRSYRPDLIYVDDPAEKQFLRDAKGVGDLAASREYCKMLIEAKSWQRLEQRLKDPGDQAPSKSAKHEKEDDTLSLEPEEQCLKYMTILKRDFGILTDGNKWRLLHHEMSNGVNKRSFEFTLGYARRAVLAGLDKDREGTAWDDLISNLKYFYYFFRKEAFYPTDGSQPFVSEALEYSKKYASRIEEDLEESFIDAMTIICNSYKRVAGVRSEEDLNLIRSVSESQLFNILFVKSCEVRNVLPLKNPKYVRISLTEIIDSIDYPKFNPTATDEFNERKLGAVFPTFKYTSEGTELYDRVMHLYSVVQKGDFGLEIVGFKETVFEKREWEFATTYRIPNKDMIRLLFTLGYTKAQEGESRKYQQIPYNFFTPRQLGSIYESFLEYTLLKANDDMALVAGKWAKATLSSDKMQNMDCPKVKKGDLYFSFDTILRKDCGSYYTPDYVVRHIVQDSLSPYVSGKTSQEILNLRVCDPAMGSGHFINAALEYITAAYREALANEILDDLRESYSESCQKVLHSCIFGVDINDRAVKLAKMGLWLASAQTRHQLQQLDGQIRKGDSLIETDIKQPYELSFDWKKQFASVFSKNSLGFNVILSNPPWGGNIDKHIEYFHMKYPGSTKQHTDSFKIFIDRALQLTRPGGRVAMIVPNTLMAQSRIKDVRELFFSHRLESLVDLGEGVFEGVTAPSCIFVAEAHVKAEDDDTFTFLRLSHLEDNVEKSKELLKRSSEEKVSFKTVRKDAEASLSPPTETYSKSVIPLGDLEFVEIRDAGINYQRVKVGFKEKGKSDLSERLLYEGRQEKKSHVMYWKGTDIDRYYVAKKTERFCRVETKGSLKSNEVVHFNEEVYDTKPKILIRQTADKPIAAIDEAGVWFGRSIIGLLMTDDSPYKLEYFLGLLNSKFMEKTYQKLVAEKGRAFAQVKVAKLKQLPIRTISFSNKVDRKLHDQLCALVRTRIEAKDEKAKDRINAEIETLIKSLYSSK